MALPEIRMSDYLSWQGPSHVPFEAHVRAVEAIVADRFDPHRYPDRLTPPPPLPVPEPPETIAWAEYDGRTTFHRMEAPTPRDGPPPPGVRSIEDMLIDSGVAQTEDYVRLAADAPEGMVPLILVPVEVFGADDCCEHGDTVVNPGHPTCKAVGYGLCDAVSAYSDCNRAVGRIYRVDDTEEHYRQPGETVVIYVREADRPFFDKTWGDG